MSDVYKYSTNPGHAEKSPEVFKKTPHKLAELLMVAVACCSVSKQNAATITVKKKYLVES